MADNVYCDIKEIAENELKKLVKKGDLSAAEMEAAKNALSTIVKATEVSDRKEMDEEYSNRGYSRSGDPYRRWEILSYGTQHMPRHSMMYPHEEHYEDSMRGRYSRHSVKDRAISKIEGMMDEAGSDYEREKMKEIIRRIEMVD